MPSPRKPRKAEGKPKRTSHTNRRPKAKAKAKDTTKPEKKRSPGWLGLADPPEVTRARDLKRLKHCKTPEDYLLKFRRGVPAPQIPRTPDEVAFKLPKPPKGFYVQGGALKKGDRANEIWIEFFKEMIRRRWRKFEMKLHFREFVISMGYRPSKDYALFSKLLAQARVEHRMEVVGLGKDDHIADAYGTMLDIVRDPNADNIDRIKAQQVINDILGLSAKYKQGTDLTEEEKAKMIADLLRKEFTQAQNPVTAEDLPDEEDTSSDEDDEEEDE